MKEIGAVSEMIIPASHRVKIMSPEEFNESWGRAWEGYLEARREKGLDDPRRLPPPEFMSKRCDI